ncbi:MAG: YihY/virulence factor BrkB family protein [Bacteroidetes bacterium]|nr:YihY/virulence factor BrkB family protein [Bacteroidota bacterium]
MKFSLLRKLLRFRMLRFLIIRLKRIRISRYTNHSVYEITKSFLINIKEHEILNRANAVAFNLTLAIFPAVIFLFTLIPYISIYFPEINQGNIMEFLETMLPRSMYDTIAETVLDIVSIQRSGLLTVGFISALFLATNGMMSMIQAFNACYKTTEIRGIWRIRMTSTLLTLILAAVLLLTMVMMIVGQLVLDYISTHLKDFSHLQVDAFSLLMFDLMRFAIVFAGFLLAISCIYYFGPSIHYNWNFFSWGSLIATIGSLAVSYGFSAYISRFGSYNKLYGSIGVLIALMIWIQLLSVVLLAGYEINATLHQHEKGPADPQS